MLSGALSLIVVVCCDDETELGSHRREVLIEKQSFQLTDDLADRALFGRLIRGTILALIEILRFLELFFDCKLFR